MKDFVIVTPVLNGREFIADCLRSVRLAFSDFSYVHVIVDGGSTDGTAEFVRTAADPAVTLIVAHGTSMYEAVNLGVQAVDSLYVYQLNCDDLVFSHMPRVVQTAFDAHSDVDILISGTVTLDLGTGLVKPKMPLPDQWSLERLSYNLFISQPSTVVRRQAFLKAGLFSESLRYAGDTELWLRMIRAGYRALVVQDLLSVDRLHGRSARLSQRHISELDRVRTQYRPGRRDPFRSFKNAFWYSFHNVTLLASGGCPPVAIWKGGYIRAILGFLLSGFVEIVFSDAAFSGRFKVEGRIRRISSLCGRS